MASIFTSVGARTVTRALPLSLAVLESVSLYVGLAVLSSCPAPGPTEPAMVSVVVAFLSSVPTVQVTTPLPEL